MGWVLTADDQLIEVSTATGRPVGTLVQHGGTVPGILVGKGGGGTPQEDVDAMVPNNAELREMVQFAKKLGNKLSKHSNFARHFNAHKGLLEKALGTTYPKGRNGETAFLKDLGALISNGKLTAVGIVTLGKNQPMAFAFQGRIGTTALTAIVFPNGQWNTLLKSDQGKASGFFYQMRFDANFPFPFLGRNSSGGMSRRYL